MAHFFETGSVKGCVKCGHPLLRDEQTSLMLFSHSLEIAMNEIDEQPIVMECPASVIFPEFINSLGVCDWFSN